MRYHAMVTGYPAACCPFFCEELDTLCNEPGDNGLWSIPGRSPNGIWAVGSLLPNANATIVQNLVEQPNGTSWSVVPIRDLGREANFLFGISDLKDGTVWATGIYDQSGGHTGWAPAMRRNGHSWKIIPAVSPGYQEDMLYSVAGISGKLHELTTPNPTAEDNYIQAIAPVSGGMKAFTAHYTG